MYRIGQSTDIHQLVENRKLIIGGVEIPFHLGLKGHSDADVLLHAIAEAILGALALNDIGTMFPDNDEKYKGISSLILLKEVYKVMDEKGYKINNIDSLVIIEKPRLRDYIDQMRLNIATTLNTSVENVNVKATTNEKLGEIGNGLAIQAHASILLRKKVI